VPVRAVVLTVTLVSLICLLNISSASNVAFGGITALGSLALYISYAIAVASMLYARSSPGGVQLGEWNLGRYGVYVNTYALAHTLYILVFLPFPSTVPVDATNMNYGGPIMGFVLAVVIALWFLRARKHWEGPNMTILDMVLAKS
jgi:amino acid transporter